MKVTIIDVAIVHFFVRFVLILTTASEIYIVMPSTGSGGAFDAIYGDSRDISQLFCCVVFGLVILFLTLIVLSAMERGAPAFQVPLGIGINGAEYGGSWLSQRRKMMLNRAFIQDHSSPVPTKYWKLYVGALSLDTLCLILWIVAVTLAFFWDKEIFLAELQGEPVAERFSDDAIETWSERWLPHKVFEIFNFLLFTTMFMMTCTVIIRPYAWRWREARKPQVILPPKGRRAILRPIGVASAEMGKEIEAGEQLCDPFVLRLLNWEKKLRQQFQSLSGPKVILQDLKGKFGSHLQAEHLGVFAVDNPSIEVVPHELVTLSPLIKASVDVH